jgi:hypothetical protein
MKIIEICEIILMFAGIVFYSVCLLFFVIGRIKPDNNITTLTIGKVDFKSNSFIVMAIISALFAFSPLIYNYYFNKTKTYIDKPNHNAYSIYGVVEGKNQVALHNFPVTVYQTRNDSLLIKKVRKTQQNGNYDVTFDTVKPADELVIAWEDTSGDTIKTNFSPTKATQNITLKTK